MVSHPELDVPASQKLRPSDDTAERKDAELPLKLSVKDDAEMEPSAATRYTVLGVDDLTVPPKHGMVMYCPLALICMKPFCV